MAQQTAVEWLKYFYNSRPAFEEFISPEEFKLAIEIEKENIINAWTAGREYGCKFNDSATGEEYYNETFNNTKNT
jgi:hypothetical protein